MMKREKANWDFLNNEWVYTNESKLPELLGLDEEGMRAFHIPPFDGRPSLFDDEEEGKG